jgi:vacuolar-type H+-ATPase subunit E/Vma4
MNKKDIELQRAAQTAETQEDYAGFEDSVLLAARAQADLIVAEARAQGDELFASLTATQRTDPLAVYRAQAENALNRHVAAQRQENRRKLLVYRKQLTEGLFAELEENLLAFAETPAYEGWVAGHLAAHSAAVESAGGCTVYLRGQDVQRLRARVLQVLPEANIEADRTIFLGGAKVAVGRVLYDDTLDSAVAAQRTQFLSQCGLRVE